MKTLAQQIGAILILLPFLLTACRSQVNSDPTDSTGLVQKTAEAEMLAGDLEAAAQIWEQSLENDPENSTSLYQLALIEMILDPEAALPHLEAAEAADPDLRTQTGRLKAAVRQATAIKDRAYQLTIAGQALSSLEEWPLAEIALERAVAENPDYAEAWAYLGEARQQAGSPGGLDALQTAYAINPESFAANLLLSIYYRRTDKAPIAIPYLETALSQQPNNLDLNAELAQTLIDAGRVPQAFEHLETLTEQYPENATIWLKLAQLSVDNNLQVAEDGLPAARQAVVLDPENPQAVLTLGRAYLLLDQPVLARRFLTQAADLDPQLAEPHYFLGILFLNTREYPSAESELHAALSRAESSGQELFVEQIKTLLSQYFP